MRIRVDGRADPGDHEFGVARVGEHVEYQRPGSRVHQFGHRPVEIGGNAVAHVGLDQPLQPVGRGGAGVEGVQRVHKRQHRLVGLGAHQRDLPAQQPEVAEFRDRHLTQGRLVGERGGQRRVIGKPEESDEFRVGQQAEQVQDTVGRALGHRRSLTTGAPQGCAAAAPAALVDCPKKPRRECGTYPAAFQLAVRRGVYPIRSAAMGFTRERGSVITPSYCAGVHGHASEVKS